MDYVIENTLPFPPDTALLDRAAALMEACVPAAAGRDIPVLRGDTARELSKGSACIVYIDGKSTEEYPPHRQFWLVPLRVELRLDRGLMDPNDLRSAARRLALALFGDSPDEKAIDRLSGGGIRVRHITDADVTEFPKSEGWPATIIVSLTVHASSLAAA